MTRILIWPLYSSGKNRTRITTVRMTIVHP